jgi:hypothetical protein
LSLGSGYGYSSGALKGIYVPSSLGGLNGGSSYGSGYGYSSSYKG